VAGFFRDLYYSRVLSQPCHFCARAACRLCVSYQHGDKCCAYDANHVFQREPRPRDCDVRVVVLVVVLVVVVVVGVCFFVVAVFRCVDVRFAIIFYVDALVFFGAGPDAAGTAPVSLATTVPRDADF